MNVIFSLTKNLDRFIQHNWNIRFDNKPWTRGTPFFFFFGTHQPLDFGSPNPPGLILSRSDLIASSRLLEHAILYIAACCGSKRCFFSPETINDNAITHRALLLYVGTQVGGGSYQTGDAPTSSTSVRCPRRRPRCGRWPRTTGHRRPP